MRFNARFGPTLVVPEAAIPPVGARIMDLQQPTAKMSTSSESPHGTLHVLEDPAVLTKRIKSAVTDSDTEIRYDPAAKPGISNLLQILAATTERPVAEVEADMAGQGYGKLKTVVADAVVEFVRPIQDRYRELERDIGEVERIIADGAARAESISAPVLARVRRAVGLLARPDPEERQQHVSDL